MHDIGTVWAFIMGAVFGAGLALLILWTTLRMGSGSGDHPPGE